jgi:hypothetical protein
MDRLRNPDTWAVAAPMLCAVHCAATPLLVVFLPALALTPAAESWLLALSAVVATLAIVPGIRVHGRLEVVVPVALGLFVWGAALAHWLHPLPEPLVSSVGAMGVAGGIFWSARLRHRVSCVACDLHGHVRHVEEERIRGGLL